MMNIISDQYDRLAPGDIVVLDARQRSELQVDEEFVSSLRHRGVLVPLLVTRARVLVAGGRRRQAALSAGLETVPVRYVEDHATPSELRLIELEENIRRAELPWRDECRAVSELHQLWCGTRENWTAEKSQSVLGHDMGRWLRVARDLDNPRLATATSLFSAFNICQRIDQRAADAAMEDITYASTALLDGATEESVGTDELGTLDEFSEVTSPPGEASEIGEAASGTGSPPVPTARAASPTLRRQPTNAGAALPPEDIICTDFMKWASNYVGPRFNFIHCDFPYGKKVFGGQWGGKNDTGFQYDDSPDVYWELVASLCKNLDRLMAPSAHLMFWLSSEIEMQHATIARFRELAPELIFQPRALVWLKSDNVGIVPDPKRGPRWITELALMASRGDRVLVQPLANAYNAPTARTLHPSAKPEPVLRHFFRMFVDDTSRVLDPTCGAGSSLRAAESLNALQVLGIEKDENYVLAARKALREFRTLRELTK
jgi:hypothetical protein